MSLSPLNELIVIDKIPFQLDRDHLLKVLRIADKDRLSNQCIELMEEAEEIGNPKALFRVISIQNKGDDWVELGEERLTSRILRVNLDQHDVAFPALATAGQELENWSSTKKDILLNFWAQTIMESILGIASATMIHKIEELYNKSVSLMTPGSLNDWPISEQTRLFNLFENANREIGVKLTDSFLMIPLKSISCLVFQSENGFVSCQLCSKENCPNRRAPFEHGLYESKYQINKCESVDESGS